MPGKSFELLKDHLKEMFYYNDNDLDFGVFKLLKMKRKEIEKFIESDEKNSLKQVVNDTLTEVNQNKLSSQRILIGNFINDKGGPDEQNLLTDIPNNHQKLIDFIKYKDPSNREEILEALDNIQNTENSYDHYELEDKIYNYILNFFENYYNAGDFGYNSKLTSEYKLGYEANYNGSDKLFHWKNKGNIYIKTAEGFNNVKFSIGPKKIEFRLESTEEEEKHLFHDNNKTQQVKHYEFQHIEQNEDTYRVIFKLSSKSTSKALIFKEILNNVLNYDEDLDDYLFKNNQNKNLIFNDLTGEYNKIESGQLKGVSNLYISKNEYLNNLVKHDRFKILGKNNEIRKEALEKDNIAGSIYKLDVNLNKFYVGNDSDYFIHEDLKGFLTIEKEKYIKNIIFSELDQLFKADSDNTTVLIAKAFNKVVDQIIKFLDAIETFQKNIFKMKKKILSTNYLVSLDKLPTSLHEELLKEEKVLEELNSYHKKNIADVTDLELRQQLIIDTKHIKNEILRRKVISSLVDINENTDALLINSENYQGLNILKNSYHQQVRCIYIDPPYNTGGDFLYKDDFRHSTWLTFMESRLLLARDLLHKDGSIFVSIDDEEAYNLKLLMDEIFGEEKFVGSIAYERSGSAGVGQGGSIVNTKEYILCYSLNKGKLNFVGYDRPLERDTMERYRSVLVEEGEKELIHEFKSASNGLPVKIYKHTNFKIEKISLRQFKEREEEIKKEYLKNLDKIFRTNNVQPENEFQNNLIAHMDKKHLYTVDYTPSRGKDAHKEITKYYYNAELFAWLKDTAFEKNGEIIKTNKITDIWPHSEIPKADLANEGGVYLSRGKKPENLLYRLIKLSTNEGDTILDFFAGSATTAATALKMNRKSIAIEMGLYFNDKTLRRMKNVLFGDKTGISAKVNWNGGGIVKYHDLEQYEDILNNLNEAPDMEIPDTLPKEYLFRAEENHIRSNFDLSKPFSNKYIYSKSNKYTSIDFMETYCYIKGYPVERIEHSLIDNKLYISYKSGNKLIVFREIYLGEDDTSNIKRIMSNYVDIEQLEVNYDVDLRKLDIETKIITKLDFDEGLLWN